MVSPLPSECEQLLIVGYVLGDLSPAEAMLFAELVADNPELMEEVTKTQQALELTYASPEIAPPPKLRASVLAANVRQNLQQEPVSPTTSAVTIPKTRSFWSRILAAIVKRRLTAIALVTIVGLSYSNYRFWQIQTANRGIPQVPQRTYSLTSQDLSQDTKAILIVNPDRLRANLITNNLPPLPPDKVYALWTVVDKDAPFTTDEKSAILTAVFEVNESGNLEREIVVPQPHLAKEAIAKIAITVEDKSAPQAHEGSILIATEQIN